jgi:hypothetical protein
MHAVRGQARGIDAERIIPLRASIYPDQPDNSAQVTQDRLTTALR